MRPVQIELDPETHKRYLELREFLKTRPGKPTIRQWFSAQIDIAHARFERAQAAREERGKR